MGALLVLCADYRLGARGDYSLRANEVAIGLTLPHAAIAVMRQRLAWAARRTKRIRAIFHLFRPVDCRDPIRVSFPTECP